MNQGYIEELKKRAKESKVYRKHQLFGLEVAQVLGDEKHKSLYIKLAKEGDGEQMLRLAKEVAERKNVKNKGAYFMSMLTKLPSFAQELRTGKSSFAQGLRTGKRNDTKVRKSEK